MHTDKIQYKIMNLVAYLKANLRDDDRINNIKLTVNKLYDSCQIETLVEELASMKNYNIKGLTFYPEISGTKLIFMLDNGNRTISGQVSGPVLIPKTSVHSPKQYQNTVVQENKQITETNDDNRKDEYQDNKKTNIRYVCKSNNPIYATFELKKTKDTDVYKLYLVETVNRNNKTVLRSKKMGIAFVPSIACSTMCRNAFCDNGDSNLHVLMKCKFLSDKNKWEPVEVDKTARYPSNISDVEKDLEILEESCSDEDN